MKKFTALALIAPLALAACAEPNAGPDAVDDTKGNALVDTDDATTAPVTQPEGEVDPSGAGPDEAYGERGDEGAPETIVPETGQAADIGGEGDDTRIADD